MEQAEQKQLKEQSQEFGKLQVIFVADQIQILQSPILIIVMTMMI